MYGKVVETDFTVNWYKRVCCIIIRISWVKVKGVIVRKLINRWSPQYVSFQNLMQIYVHVSSAEFWNWAIGKVWWTNSKGEKMDMTQTICKAKFLSCSTWAASGSIWLAEPSEDVCSQALKHLSPWKTMLIIIIIKQ